MAEHSWKLYSLCILLNQSLGTSTKEFGMGGWWALAYSLRAALRQSSWRTGELADVWRPRQEKDSSEAFPEPHLKQKVQIAIGQV